MASSSNTSHTYSRPHIRTLEGETAHDRLLRTSSFSSSRRPPKSMTDLDVLKAKNQFIRDSNIDPSQLSWEDSLALKYYQTLFRDSALVNLKHSKSGAIALRWRTESEVLAEIGRRTCSSLRCEYHLPSLSLLAEEEEDEESEEPLVPTRLYEFEVPFGYLEEGQKKSALVKVILCKECGKKLKKGREAGKRKQEEEVERLMSSSTPRREGKEHLESSERRRSASPDSRCR